MIGLTVTIGPGMTMTVRCAVCDVAEVISLERVDMAGVVFLVMVGHWLSAHRAVAEGAPDAAR